MEFRPQPRKQAFGAILCFSGLWQDLTSTFCIHRLLFEFRPQPRQRAFAASLCSSRLWQDQTSTFCIDCHDCRQNPVQNPDRPGPDPNTRTRPGPDRANPDTVLGRIPPTITRTIHKLKNSMKRTVSSDKIFIPLSVIKHGSPANSPFIDDDSGNRIVFVGCSSHV